LDGKNKFYWVGIMGLMCDYVLNFSLIQSQKNGIIIITYLN
jgi:hypothetical protein